MRQYMHQQRLQAVPLSNRSSIAGQSFVVKGSRRNSIKHHYRISKETIENTQSAARYLNARLEPQCLRMQWAGFAAARAGSRVRIRNGKSRPALIDPPGKRLLWRSLPPSPTRRCGRNDGMLLTHEK